MFTEFPKYRLMWQDTRGMKIIPRLRLMLLLFRHSAVGETISSPLASLKFLFYGQNPIEVNASISRKVKEESAQEIRRKTFQYMCEGLSKDEAEERLFCEVVGKEFSLEEFRKEREEERRLNNGRTI